MTRDEAIIVMVESNLQRSVILPSEKAFAYKMRPVSYTHLDVYKRQQPYQELKEPLQNHPKALQFLKMYEAGTQL